MCKYEYCWIYRADTILSTEGQTDKVKPVYPPFNFVEAGSIKSLENSAEAGNQGDLTNGPHFWMF